MKKIKPFLFSRPPVIRGVILLESHYNLYYIFREDKQAHPLSEAKKQEIQKNIENFLRKIKPP